MRFADDDRSVLEDNNQVRIAGISAEGHDYQVNGRTPIEWLIDFTSNRIGRAVSSTTRTDGSRIRATW